MSTPMFYDVPSAEGCQCPACSAVRLARNVRRLRRAGLGDGRAHGRAQLRPVVTVAAGTVLAGTGVAHAAQSSTPPSTTFADLPGPTDLPGPSDLPTDLPGSAGLRSTAAWTMRGDDAGPPVLTELTRAEIVSRAARWLNSRVPYSRSHFRDGYRTDCSGFISMAWGLDGSAWTGNLTDFAVPIAKDDLAAGDILLFHNPADPERGSHVVLFDHWADRSHTSYVGYEQSRPHTLRRTIPYGYFTHGTEYRAYRYRNLASGISELPFPGAESFGPGASNSSVTLLGSMLVGRGGGRFYTEGPGPEWGDADRAATQAFQQAQGWRDAEADGLPGPHTWRLLINGGGRDIPGDALGAGRTPDFPGVDSFAPGRSGSHVLALGRQLTTRGYDSHYRVGPDPIWTEADRLNVQDFQRAQGWRGTEADGYPGPDTWTRLFE
ncbi:peptidoglycan-binding protein [Peterkaempfera bronchialis]|uniref:peptidoglycan-binding protein n=1 Tax=Peterkaempfera bronchialis TaxID=2126346 RepID=UPI0013B4446E|nr:peptidoglycan-binding protein [Peterkaempfera bronchialis]